MLVTFELIHFIERKNSDQEGEPLQLDISKSLLLSVLGLFAKQNDFYGVLSEVG